MSIPDDARKNACLGYYAEAMQIVGNVVAPLANADPERLNGLVSDPEVSARTQESLDTLEMLLDLLENQCGDVLNEGMMGQVRDLRDQLEQLRNGMRMGLVEQILDAGAKLVDGFFTLGRLVAGALGASGAFILNMIEQMRRLSPAH